MDKSEMGKNGDGFIDRSKVRILLCDNDEKSSEEAYTLLCKCSYQVTAVKSPRQVIDALNAEGPDIDLILSEVDLPMSKGLKLLKYIMRDKELRRIPVIMMSAQDEVPIVVKCLKFGAADYLVKPLRTNELLNLWTHMWRRRRMLGLAEKNIISYDFDLIVSDHSDANTNSTTLFSDDTGTNPEMAPQDDESNTATAAPSTAVAARTGCQPDVPGISDRRTGSVQMLSFPKKSELKIGESSAFFTYVKSVMPKSIAQSVPQLTNLVEPPILDDDVGPSSRGEKIGQTGENYVKADDHQSTNSVSESLSVERSCTPPMPLDISQHRNSKEFPMHSGNNSHNDMSGCYNQTVYPYIPGVMHQVPTSSPHPKNVPETHSLASSSLVSPYNHIQHMAPYPYYPFGICLQPGQIPASHPWTSFGNPSASEEGKSSKVNRREVALMKFRQKRKERCFDKKIRYVNRKKLAERRPRVRGQFVRKVNGVTVDLNGQPASTEDDEEEEEYNTSNMDYSPEDDASMCQ